MTIRVTAVARASLVTTDFDPRLLLFLQFFFLVSFYSSAYLMRPLRLVRSIRQIFKSGHEQTVLVKLLHAKLGFRKRSKQAGVPISIAMNPRAVAE